MKITVAGLMVPAGAFWRITMEDAPDHDIGCLSSFYPCLQIAQ